MKNIYISLIVLLCSCNATKETAVNMSRSGSIVIDARLFTSLFMQQAAEYDALCHQAYNIAKLRLDESTAGNKSSRPRAIVTDIDETILDNSPYDAARALIGEDYEHNSWVEWTGRATADTLVGALSFFNYATSQGVEIFYVTNRDEEERVGTLANLKRYGFPNADDRHLILKTTASSKESRRAQISETHDIIMLIGDNLADFSSLFDKKTTQERADNVSKLANEFGNRFIVLPNAMYGDWESALYNYNYNYTPAQKDSIIKSKLKIE